MTSTKPKQNWELSISTESWRSVQNICMWCSLHVYMCTLYTHTCVYYTYVHVYILHTYFVWEDFLHMYTFSFALLEGGIFTLLLLTVYHMKETGWVKISQDDTMKLHFQYQEEKLGDAAHWHSTWWCAKYPRCVLLIFCTCIWYAHHTLCLH